MVILLCGEEVRWWFGQVRVFEVGRDARLGGLVRGIGKENGASVEGD